MTVNNVIAAIAIIALVVQNATRIVNELTVLLRACLPLVEAACDLVAAASPRREDRKDEY